jgi:hypothetical protein
MRAHFGMAAALIWLITPAFAQDPADDAKAEVPALRNFHKVIYVIWHEAWPAKDVAKLQELVPAVERGAAEVCGARLPGVLHHKETDWNKGVAELEATVARYRAAAQAGNNDELLNAAEELHSQFEKLVRLTRPVIRELEDFHSSLYMVYHHYMPNNRMDKVKAAALEMKDKMVPLQSAALPERLSARKPDFVNARTELARAVEELAAAVAADDEARIRKAVEEVHTRYEVTAGIVGAH